MESEVTSAIFYFHELLGFTSKYQLITFFDSVIDVHYPTASKLWNHEGILWSQEVSHRVICGSFTPTLNLPNRLAQRLQANSKAPKDYRQETVSKEHVLCNSVSSSYRDWFWLFRPTSSSLGFSFQYLIGFAITSPGDLPDRDWTPCLCDQADSPACAQPEAPRELP